MFNLLKSKSKTATKGNSKDNKLFKMLNPVKHTNFMDVINDLHKKKFKKDLIKIKKMSHNIKIHLKSYNYNDLIITI